MDGSGIIILTKTPPRTRYELRIVAIDGGGLQSQMNVIVQVTRKLDVVYDIKLLTIFVRQHIILGYINVVC